MKSSPRDVDFDDADKHPLFSGFVAGLNRDAQEKRAARIAQYEADRTHIRSGGSLEETPSNTNYAVSLDRGSGPLPGSAYAYIDRQIASLRHADPLEVNDAVKAHFTLWLRKQASNQGK